MIDDAPRCRRGERCTTSQRLRDPVTGDHLGWVGAELTGADTGLSTVRDDIGVIRHRNPVPGSLTGLCPGCVTTVDQALIHLPLDVVELTQLLPSALTGSGAESGQITRPDPGPATPLQVHLHALRDLIDHEVAFWAWATAGEIGLEWSRVMERHSRIGARVETAVALLRYQLGAFLSLPATAYRARSLTARRADGHDLEQCRVWGDDIWDTGRDGIEGATVLLGLHQLVWRLASHSQAPDRLHLPCRNRGCCRTALIHWPGEPDVVCTACGAVIKWDDYDTIRGLFLAA